ncbi:MAG: prolyl oligopeptidase family serine peptidase [Burkholderiaceae bacterium]|nr:prolyl oligopeptidase family serine peptidase [Burkholderiaceae bacterium]
MRRGLAGAEKLLFDPEVLKKETGKAHAVNYFTPSPDGNVKRLLRMAYQDGAAPSEGTLPVLGSVGISGGISAGGILVGRAMTERPDLFAVVIPAVGALDLVRAETTPNGVPNIPEFGSRATEPGFRALLAMSTYHHINDGVRYPAVLLTHGANDPRVEVWNSTKTAARLMAASTSGKPIVLRLDYDSGHGSGNTKSQSLDQRADSFAFALWQMGVKGYSPKGQ